MKKFARLMSAALVALMTISVFAACKGGEAPEKPTQDQDKQEETEFVPKLDTQKEVTIDIASFFGNFEALDQVILDFNKFYPNVNIRYEQLNSFVSDFFKNNPGVDIFMTSNEKGYPVESCVDLIDAGVDPSAARENVITANKYEGTLYTIPMSLNLKGIVVNKTLLAEEGLEVPQTVSEFMNVLETLKQKGYTPIQGPNSAVSTLCYNMGMAMLANDTALLDAAKSGDKTGAAALKSVWETMKELTDKGYINAEVNAEYPDDNYDGAIMKFMEGNVPFWVCDTEKVSGMKKRESKSEAFKADPFEYEFKFAPLGENGAYEYIEPWYGFAVYKDSDVADYSVEFLRFLVRADELNTLASVKGVPSITNSSVDARYINIGKAKAELAVASDGSVPASYGTALNSATEGLLDGTFANADDALNSFLENCTKASAEN